jgi:hypothetical protein
MNTLIQRLVASQGDEATYVFTDRDAAEVRQWTVEGVHRDLIALSPPRYQGIVADLVDWHLDAFHDRYSLCQMIADGGLDAPPWSEKIVDAMRRNNPRLAIMLTWAAVPPIDPTSLHLLQKKGSPS